MKSRVLVPERMDDPGLDPQEHARALAGLRRINHFSGTPWQIAREILEIASRHPRNQYRILDLGCANGELVYKLIPLLIDRIPFHITGWDRSEYAIEQARKGIPQWAEQNPQFSSGAPVSFEVQDVFAFAADDRDLKREPRSVSHSVDGDAPFDIVFCTLFLHHFEDTDAVRVLDAMRRLARIAVLVDDLRRTHFGWWLATLGCHLLSRSPVVHFDGPQSVRAAFDLDEARRMAALAGMHNVSMRTHWPQRFAMRWERPQS